MPPYPMLAPDSASFLCLNALRYLVLSYVTKPTTMSAMTEIPANTPRPMGSTDMFLPGRVKADVCVSDDSAAAADPAAAADAEAAVSDSAAAVVAAKVVPAALVVDVALDESDDTEVKPLTESALPAEAETEDVSELLAVVAAAASELLEEDASTVTEEKPLTDSAPPPTADCVVDAAALVTADDEEVSVDDPIVAVFTAVDVSVAEATDDALELSEVPLF